MKPSEILRGARELLEKPGAWTRGWFARDEFGGTVNSGLDHEACKWCAYGALQRVSGKLVPHDAARFLDKVIGREHPWTIAEWNDKSRTRKSDVLSAFDEAIALAEHEESARAEESEKGE
jgi:hypothetical protein